MLISIIGILLTILIIVGFHEAGHFVVARMVGVKVLRFSIGFGKTLLRWHDKSGTEYVIAAVPLGGYVKMLDETEDAVPEQEKKFAFNQQPYYKKLAVVIAGPLTNLILACVLYWIVFMLGFKSIAPVIDTVQPHSIAANAGLRSHQEIMSVDEIPTHGWMSVILRIMFHTGDTDHLQIKARSFTNTLAPHTYQLDLTNWHMDSLKPDPLKSLGLAPYFPNKPIAQWPAGLIRNIQYAPLPALQHAWQDTVDFTRLNLMLFAKLFTGKVSLQSLGGPISIFESAGDAFHQGVAAYLSYLAFISIAIGIVNIFPLPGLDGGHVLIQTIEWIRRRPLSTKTLALLYRVGFIIIILILFQAVVNDILRLKS